MNAPATPAPTWDFTDASCSADPIAARLRTAPRAREPRERRARNPRAPRPRPARETWRRSAIEESRDERPAPAPAARVPKQKPRRSRGPAARWSLPPDAADMIASWFIARLDQMVRFGACGTGGAAAAAAAAEEVAPRSPRAEDAPGGRGRGRSVWNGRDANRRRREEEEVFASSRGVSISPRGAAAVRVRVPRVVSAGSSPGEAPSPSSAKSRAGDRPLRGISGGVAASVSHPRL